MTNIYKIEAILAYITNYPGMSNLGKVKLMKLFYFIDFDHVKQYGTPVTKDTYVNLEHGPIPSRIKNLIDALDDDPQTSFLKNVVACEHPTNTERMCKIIAKRAFTDEDEDLFSDSELKVLKDVCEKYKASLTQEIEQDSHNEAPWRETEKLDKIPYYLASHDSNSKYTEEEIKLAHI